MSHKQLVEVCNFPTSINELDLVKTNWLPICVNGTDTWYVAETSTFNNTTGSETTPVKIYKQGANGTISFTAPVGTITEGYCVVPQQDIEFIYGCETQLLSINATATPLSVTGGTTLNFTNPVATLYTTPAVAYVDKVIVDWGDGEYFVGSPALGGPQTHIPNVSLASGTYQAKLYVSTLDGDIFQLATLGYTYNQATNAVVSTGISTSSAFAYRYIRNLIQRINTATGAITYQTDTGATTTIGAGNTFYADCKTPQEQTIEELVLSNGQPVYEAVALTAGTHTITAGTGNIPAGAESVTIKKTLAVGTVSVNGYILTALNETISLSANDYDSNSQTWRLPAITVTNAGGATHQWITVI